MASTTVKDTELQHDEKHEETPAGPLVNNSADVTGFEVHEASLPKGYFYSRYFVGSYLAIGFGLWGGTAAL